MLNGHRGPGWFPTSFPIFIVLYLIIYFKHYKNETPSTVLRYTLYWIYAFILVDLTQAPFPYTTDAFTHIQDFHHFRYNVIPFDSMHLLQFQLNILLFIPLGYIITSLRTHYRWYNVTFIGLAVSLAIELVQLLTSLSSINVRSFDVDDLITNTLGALIGYLIYRIFQLVKSKVK